MGVREGALQGRSGEVGVAGAQGAGGRAGGESESCLATRTQTITGHWPMLAFPLHAVGAIVGLRQGVTWRFNVHFERIALAVKLRLGGEIRVRGEVGSLQELRSDPGKTEVLTIQYQNI